MCYLCRKPSTINQRFCNIWQCNRCVCLKSFQSSRAVPHMTCKMMARSCRIDSLCFQLQLHENVGVQVSVRTHGSAWEIDVQNGLIPIFNFPNTLWSPLDTACFG